MSDQNFWRDLKVEFRQIAGEVGCQCSPDHQPLQIPGEFHEELYGDVSDSVDSFMRLANRGMVALGAQQRQGAWRQWVSMLGEKGLGTWQDNETNGWIDREDDPPPRSWVLRHLTLLNACAASAELCGLLEASAVSGRQKAEGKPETPAPAVAAPVQLDKWSDLEIRFLSDKMIQVYIKGKAAEPFNYDEFGLGDRRTGRPRMAWPVLLALADGPIHVGFENRRTVESRVKEIRNVIRSRYVAGGDPLPITSAQYEPAFKVSKAPAFGDPPEPS